MFTNGNDKINLSVTCGAGIETVTKKELERNGVQNPVAINGEISFLANVSDIAKLNINLRTADRVYVKLATFKSENFDALYEGVKRTRFEDYVVRGAKITVNGKCVRSNLFAVSACQSIVKKAIVDRLCSVYGTKGLKEEGAEYHIEFKIFKDECTLLLDTSGTGLHKRGYRNMVGIAPIRETLASALVLLSDYYRFYPFADPFCGSGTIAIECAQIAKNIAPGLNREFAFDKWGNFQKSFKAIEIERARDNELKDFTPQIFASDIDGKAIKIAKEHAKRAGVANCIDFKVQAVKDFSSDLSSGTIVTNPPYGERVYDQDEARRCYKELGGVMKNLDRWSCFVITSAKFFQNEFGKTADRNRKLFNSNRECKYYYYYANKMR